MRSILLVCTAAAVCLLGSSGAAASSWRKVMAVDPYSNGTDNAHYYDYGSTFQDSSTGWIVTHLQFVSADKAAAGNVPSWYLWAYDCNAKVMRDVGFEDGKSFKVEDGWRDKTYPLSGDKSDSVTAELGNQLCAMSGLWPAGKLKY